MRTILFCLALLSAAAGRAWAEEAASTAPFESKWPVLTNFSLAFPNQNIFSGNYDAGGGFGIGVGYRFTPALSLWLDYDYKGFTARYGNPLLSYSSYGLNLSTYALWVRYTVLTSGTLRPFFFTGPAFSTCNLSTSDTSNNMTSTISLSQTAFAPEVGVGLEIGLNPYLDFVGRGKFTYYLVTQDFADNAAIDQPARAFSFEIGFEYL